MKKKGKKPRVEEQDKKKGQTFTESDLMDKSIMRNTEYPCFLPSDAIYYVTRSNLLNTDMRFMIRKMLGELNYLLYLSFKEFWSTLLYSPSLKKCLESCLSFFNRKKYNQYVREDVHFQEITDNETAEYQSHLFKVVLKIFYRILNGDQENPDLWSKYRLSQDIYDKWILDIPKVFDLMDVYASDNKQIVHIMVKKLFELHEDYKQDFIDALKIISKETLPKIFDQLKAINDREEFEEGATETELRKKMRTMMTIKDIQGSLIHAYEFFPEDCSIYIIMDTAMLKYLENVYYEIYSGYKYWKLGVYGSKLHPIMDSIILDTVKLWQLSFQRFRQVVYSECVPQGVSRKQITLVLNDVLKNFGTVLSMGAKNRDKKRNFMLLERLIDQADLEQFLQELLEAGQEISSLDTNIVEQLNTVVKGIIKLKNQRMGIEQQPEPEKVEQQVEEEEVREDKLPAMDDKPVRQPSFKPPMRKEPSKVETEQMRQKRRKILQRQYDDDYDDFVDYNRRVNEKVVDDTDSGDQEELKPAQSNQPPPEKRQGWRQGRGKGRQQPPKRGEQRHFDSSKVIEERNKQLDELKPRYVEKQIKVQKEKYVQKDRQDRSRNEEPKKKKYREKT